MTAACPQSYAVPGPMPRVPALPHRSEWPVISPFCGGGTWASGRGSALPCPRGCRPSLADRLVLAGRHRDSRAHPGPAFTAETPRASLVRCGSGCPSIVCKPGPTPRPPVQDGGHDPEVPGAECTCSEQGRHQAGCPEACILSPSCHSFLCFVISASHFPAPQFHGRTDLTDGVCVSGNLRKWSQEWV